jgi:thymidylate synthase (FAD)
MKVELITYMGSDLTVVNAARVTFKNHREKFLSSDIELIKKLAQHNHWTPFAQPQLQFRLSAPIFIARELSKHQIGLSWNEVSMDLVHDVPCCYIPDSWRKKPDDIKQGSSEEMVELSFDDIQYIGDTHMNALGLYERLIGKGVDPKQARMVLPQSTYTQWYWTGSLYAFSRICNLHLSEDNPSKEIHKIVEQINDLCSNKFPISWTYLVQR